MSKKGESSTSSKGRKREFVYVTEPPSHFMCHLCLDILDDPVSSGCPDQHMFCKTCLGEFEGETCPVCRQPLSKELRGVSQPFIKKAVNDYAVYCMHRDGGCEWIGPAGDHENHISRFCEHHSCSNELYGCDWHGKMMDREEHLVSECGYCQVECRHAVFGCRWKGARRDEAAHLHGTCEFIACSNAEKGCDWRGGESWIDSHRVLCEFEEVECPNKRTDGGCGFTGERRSLADHLASDCPVELEIRHKERMKKQRLHFQSVCGNLNPPLDELVRFNVGGVVHSILRKSVCKDRSSLFGYLFSENWDIRYDDSGNILLDANAAVFPHILNWLRK